MKPTTEHAWNLNLATALRESLREGYSRAHLRADVLAGLTVGIVAVPLAMALAIASGVPPQHGLYTAIIAGAIIALLGGSRLSVAGPTAAFVVVLFPIAQQFGLGGLVLATFMAGVMLLMLGLGRMGRLIHFIPYTVTVGFTAGIAVVIATLQIKDFLGLDVLGDQEHFFGRMAALAQALPTSHLGDVLIGLTTFAVLALWPRLKAVRVPGHLVALALGTLLGWALARFGGFEIATIGSRFFYEQGGQVFSGIPPMPPMPVLPWNLPGADGLPLGLSFDTVRALFGPAMAIAVLGAIESLLCAVVVDGLAGTRHDPDAELVAQGIGNMVVPFFGGIAATGAIARSATNFRAGARSPIAAVVHALVILAVMLGLAGLLAYLPMAALAALLLMVAWNMSEAKHFVHVLRVAPKSDILVLVTCFALTVVFDMVIAVGVGVVLAALLFMKRMAETSGAKLLEEGGQHLPRPLPEGVRVYQVSGPLFFGAAEKALSTLRQIGSAPKVVVLDLSAVPIMDVSGLVALDTALGRLQRHGACVVLAGVQPQPQRVLKRAGVKDIEGRLAICGSLDAALERARRHLDGDGAAAVITP